MSNDAQIGGKLGGTTWVEHMAQPANSPKLTFEAVVKGLDAITDRIDELEEKFPGINFYDVKKELSEFLLYPKIVTQNDLVKAIDEQYIPSLRVTRSWIEKQASAHEAAANLVKDTVAVVMGIAPQRGA